MKKLSRHSPKRRKLGIEAVRGSDGVPILDKKSADNHLTSHWGGKFKEHAIEEAEAAHFTTSFSKPFPTIQWMLTFAAFVNIISGCKKSAPGPDGVPYATWASSFRAQIVLYSCYVTWLIIGYVPVFFNIACLWLLPKFIPADGIFDTSDTRPLSGANTDAKILAMAIATRMNSVIDSWANDCQRGFIQG